MCVCACVRENWTNMEMARHQREAPHHVEGEWAVNSWVGQQKQRDSLRILINSRSWTSGYLTHNENIFILTMGDSMYLAYPSLFQCMKTLQPTLLSYARCSTRAWVTRESECTITNGHKIVCWMYSDLGISYKKLLNKKERKRGQSLSKEIIWQQDGKWQLCLILASRNEDCRQIAKYSRQW